MESLNNKNNMRDGGRSNLATANNNSYYAAGRDYLGRFSWPPRPYTCSFCKREFRSAQALGGHMNVHRRDRARLRQSPPPWDNHQPAAHPPPPPPKIIASNPNFIINSSSSSSSSSAKNQFPPLVTYTSTYPCHPMLMSSTTTSSVPTLADDHHEKKPTTLVLCSTIDPSSSKYSRDELTKKQTSVIKRSTTTSLFEVEELNQGFIHEDDNCCKNLMKEVAAEISVTLDLEIGLSCKDDLDLELRLGYS